MISAVPSVSSVHVELDGRLPSTAGRTDETTKSKSVQEHTHQLAPAMTVTTTHELGCPLDPGDIVYTSSFLLIKTYNLLPTCVVWIFS
jgi:hypothetical protein